jgi:heat shock protein HslJ
MNAKRTTVVGIALMVAALLAACRCSGATALSNTAWELESLAGNDVLPGSTITLEFSSDEVSGSAGCNQYGGSYRAGADSLSISGVFSTMMACVGPEGVMEQEQAYLAALRRAASYRISGDRLEILDGTGTQVLAFVAPGSRSAAMPTPTAQQPTPAPPTATEASPTVAISATVEPTPSPAAGPPAGYQQYRDSVVGVSVFIPDGWVVSQAIPGQYAILQSYPEDKYTGGEAFEPGDTKCDLIILEPYVDMADYVQEIKSDPLVTILSEREVVLQSGGSGTRVEAEGMGRSLSMITQVNERVVVLVCFGDLAPFDEIAVTLGTSG